MARRSRSWRPARIGSRARKAMPRHAFLIPSQRKYPYKSKDPRTGRYVTDETGLMAAYRRAIMQKNPRVRDKALKILNPLRKRKGLPILPLKK